MIRLKTILFLSAMACALVWTPALYAAEHGKGKAPEQSMPEARPQQHEAIRAVVEQKNEAIKAAKESFKESAKDAEARLAMRDAIRDAVKDKKAAMAEIDKGREPVAGTFMSLPEPHPIGISMPPTEVPVTNPPPVDLPEQAKVHKK